MANSLNEQQNCFNKICWENKCGKHVALKFNIAFSNKLEFLFIN